LVAGPVVAILRVVPPAFDLSSQVQTKTRIAPILTNIPTTTLGLDQLTSSRFITFMERNLSDMFSPARNAGFMAYNDVCNNPNLSWYAGLFHSEIDDDPVDEQEDSGDWSATGRTV